MLLTLTVWHIHLPRLFVFCRIRLVCKLLLGQQVLAASTAAAAAATDANKIKDTSLIP